MVSWLLLGCGGAGHAFVESLADRRGDLLVVDPDEAHVDRLRNEKIDATLGDVTDPETVGNLEIVPDVVVVAGDAVAQNRAAATVAADLFPSAHVLAFAGPEATRSDVAALETVADEVFSPGRAVVDHVFDVVSDGQARRLRDLHATLDGIDGTLGVFMHDNPDPDAIAAAVALAEIAAWHGVEARPVYFGRISHQENRAFVNLLELRLENLDPADPIAFDGIALVDHSTPGVNDQLPRDTDVDIVIDHHPSKRHIEADFVDVREDVGATSTLLVDYLKGYHIDLDVAVATALLYGIRIDTNDFSRGITRADFEAAALLVSQADVDVLERIENPSISTDTFEIIGRAIRNRRRHGPVLTTCVGALSDRDALAQAADRLLNIEGVTVTLVYGYTDGTVYASARSRGVDIDLGEALREAYDDMGSAGGHADMAGAQISLGIFEDVDAEDELTAMVEDVVTSRFFEVVDPDALAETAF